ncbi:MAG TPA: RES family NAD+ phosphorylase [Micromonospora sp.]
MKCCEACFQPHANPLKALTEEAAALGNCDLCGDTGVNVWPATALLDAMGGVVDHYESAPPGDAASAPIAEQLQRDWSIFTVGDFDRIREFLNDVFSGSNAFVASNQPVRLRRAGGVDGTDHVDAWDRLAGDLMYGNRYFPSIATHYRFLADILKSRVKRVDPGVDLFRARVCDHRGGFPSLEMSMPPRGKACAGRANPAGIPHLYLAMDEETCIRESRATQHNFVTVARFRVGLALDVLNLADVKLLDPFAIEKDAASALDAARTVQRLGYELRRPVRPTDDTVEYVPTQYLSGLVKSLGFDGILYSSSLCNDGVNIVLFSDAKVSVEGVPVTHEITSVTLQCEVVT